MAFTRDPVSVLLDNAARQLLARAYAERAGRWVMTRLPDPSPAHIAWARGEELDDLMGPDHPTTASGRNDNAHTRWGRAFTRSLYYQHKWYGDRRRRGGFRAERRTVPYTVPLQVEWGARVRARGIIPAGRAIRVRIAYGGATAARAVRAKPARDQIYAPDGTPAGRHADPARTDWQL